MSTNSDSENRGASIRPSARPPIRSSRGLDLNPIEMGRHGLNASPRSEPQASPGGNICDQGRDEVDNVMSKFARTSPLRNTRNRRLSIEEQSMNRSKSDTTDDDSSQENVRHATSLPTRLSNHMYYREDITRQTLNNKIILERAHAAQGYNSRIADNSDNSSQFRGSSQSPNNRSRSFREQSIHEDTNNSRLRTDNNHSTCNENSYYVRNGIIIAVIIIAVLFQFSDPLYGIWQGNERETKGHSYNRKEFSNDLFYLFEKYKIYDEHLLKFESGLATISEKADAGSFIFVYNSNALNFDATIFNKFVNELSSKAAKYLRGDSSSIHHVEIDGSKLNMKTHSELLNRYREEVNQSGVMLVKGIDEIPSALAMAFHYYCDEYSPVAKKSAILFTLDINKCSQVPDKLSIHRRIEKCLSSKWSGVPSDNIAPLLSRVVDVVVDVTRA